MRGIGAGTRIFDLLDRKPLIPPDTGIDVPAALRGPVRFEGVQFEYPTRKGVDILKEFDLEIGVGESVAIVYVSISPECPLHLNTDLYTQWRERKRKIFHSFVVTSLLRPR